MTAQQAINAAADVLCHHLPDNAYEVGCRLACGYDGSNLDVHLAAVVVAAVTPLIREQIAAEIATAVSGERSQHWNCGLNEAWAIAMKGLPA